MKSRWVINIFLLLSIAVLSIIGYYKPGIEEPINNQLTHLQPADVNRIRIRSSLTEGVDLYKQQGEWFIQAQTPILADPARVIPLTRLSTQNISHEYPVDQFKKENIGLMPPRSTVTLNDIQLEFGGIDALESLRYIQTKDRLVLISDNYQHLINADFIYYSNPRIVRKSQRIQSIQLPDLTITKSDGAWLMIPEMQISQDTIAQFITRWENTSAINIERYEKRMNTEKMTLSLKQPDEILHLEILESRNSLVIGRPNIGLQYKLGGRSEELLHISSPATETPDK